MPNFNSNGDAAKNAASPFAQTALTFDAGSVVGFWQSSGARLMQAREIFMRGMTEVGRLEMELGQHMIQRGMAGLKPPAQGEDPQALARAQFGQAAQDYTTLIASLRKIADESRIAYNEAALALFGAESPVTPAAAPLVKDKRVPMAPGLAHAPE